MAKSHVILKQTLQLDGDKYDVHIKVIEVPRSHKFPQGYKVSCALVDKSSGDLIILLDNHEPYGYHLHAKLPEDKNYRVSIDIRDYTEAIKFFFEEVKRIQHDK